jgi:hypothetical protein
MIVNGDRNFNYLDLRRAHGFVQKVGFELIRVEPCLIDVENGIIEDRQINCPEAVGAVGDALEGETGEHQRVEPGGDFSK